MTFSALITFVLALSWVSPTASARSFPELLSGARPWLHIEAGSEQRGPVFIGATPRQMEAYGYTARYPVMPVSMRIKAEKQLRTISKYLGEETLEVEAWPVQDDEGQRTWAFARWRSPKKPNWQWLDRAEYEQWLWNQDVEPSVTVVGMFPETLRPWISSEASRIFDDFMDLDSLYDKPAFGECVWTNEVGSELLAAWLPPSKAKDYRESLTSERAPGARPVCHRLPQLARFNARPVVLPIRFQKDHVVLPDGIRWVTDQVRAGELDEEMLENRITSWPDDFKRQYRRDVMIYAGEKTAYFPISKRRSRFRRKNSADPRNQLVRFVEYLEERYERLGIRTFRQEFSWRGIPQANLIAVIPGSAPDAAEKPVLLADHIDTAFSETYFEETGKRVAAPGADDNGTAVAALLRAAEILKDREPRYDIHLVHLTGEEYPADCLGARYYVSKLLEKGRDIRGLVLMDMIGYRDPKYGNKFQINAGESTLSVRLARLAYESSAAVAPELVPIFRSRFDERSYLYNTDGIIFSDAGYPVILLNEYINKLENLNRPHYHQTSDTSDTIDFDYATSIVKVAIETAARLAETK